MQSYNYNGYGGGGGGRGQHHYYSNSSNAAGGPGVYHPFYFYSPSPMMILVQQQPPQQRGPTTSNAELEPTASSHTLTLTGKQQQHPLRQDPTRRRNWPEITKSTCLLFCYSSLRVLFYESYPFSLPYGFETKLITKLCMQISILHPLHAIAIEATCVRLRCYATN